MEPMAIEPLLWLVFSAGGVAVALLIPVLLFLFGLAFPLGWLAPPRRGHLLAVLAHPRTHARRAGPSDHARGPLPTVLAGAVSLGAPLPLHPLRRVTDQAPQRTDQPVLLRRRRRRITPRGLSPVAGPVRRSSASSARRPRPTHSPPRPRPEVLGRQAGGDQVCA